MSAVWRQGLKFEEEKKATGKLTHDSYNLWVSKVYGFFLKNIVFLLVSLKILFHDSKDVEGEDDGRSTGHNYFIKTLITDTENGPLCRIQMILRPEV